ncbi:DUF3147 family protein [Alicyclobacillus sp. SO9]|uniref:DUF3147 family protein n=1 Tax=Alicyclobacillus sp. SO9 TaxID=2665646 RepID=UPI0018E7DF5E|nr:DUF3147 family protein [Alicyclobacillus sp. SO9]QQE78171.1 DUF3147 family protein [Alicyclobacillus sp. SO9]
MKALMPYLIRFFVGGMTVAGVSLLANVSPRISGLLAAFPAVFLTALVLIRFSAGHGQTVHFARGGIHGAIGTMLTAVVTLAGLLANLPWYAAIAGGLIAYASYGLFIVAKSRA